MNNKYDNQSDKQIQWTAFMNGEKDHSFVGDPSDNLDNELTSAWEAAGLNFSYTAADPDNGWLQIQNKIQVSEKIVRFKKFKNRAFQYAAIFLMVIGIGYATWLVVKSPPKVGEIPVQMALAETTANPSNVTRIVLPDGSVVKLNANTKIEYPQHFYRGIRIVKLSGEAFFEVAKDSVHPFKIETANATVEVLGTSFNVSAYPNTNKVEVNVETGKVRLTPILKSTSEAKVLLLPAGQRGWIKVVEGESGQDKTLAPNYGSWMTNVITFQRTPLSEVCQVLQNTYHIKLRIENPELGRVPYTANFSDLNPDYIINVIARTHHLKVKKSGDEIILTRSVN